MSRAVFATSLIAGLLVAAGSAGATTDSDRMYNGKSVHGEEVAAPQKTRVVDVDNQKVLNVDCGEIVTFQRGGKSFSWKFDSAGHRAVDLRVIAPAGFADKPLMVYVSRNEAERT